MIAPGSAQSEPYRRRLRRTTTALSVAASAFALVVSGCGSSNSSSNDTTSASAGSDVSYAEAQVAKYEAVPAFTFKGAPFDASRAKGKTIANIPLTTAVPFIAGVDSAMKSVSQRLGINMIEYPNQGQPTQWVQAMNLAIAKKVDLINLQAAPDPRVLGPQIAAAKRAGIPVTLTHQLDINQACPAGITACVSAQYGLSGRLSADYAIAKSGGKAHVLYIDSAETLPSQVIKPSVADELKKHCGSGCSLTTVNVPVADWGTKLQPVVQSALLKDPTINWVIPIFDGMTQFITPAITTTHNSGRVGIASYNGTPAVLDLIAKGSDMKMDSAESLDWIAYANLDQIMRIMLRLPSVDEELPLRVFDSTNISEAGSPAQFSKGFGDAYRTGYEKIWSGQ